MADASLTQRHELKMRLETLASLGVDLNEQRPWDDSSHLDRVLLELSPNQDVAEALGTLDQALDVLRKVA